MKTLFRTGLRRDEINRLDIYDIDFERKRMELNGKGRKIRVVPVVDDELLSDLKHLIGDHNSGLFFRGQTVRH